MNLWLIILLAGMITFGIRLSFVLIHNHWPLPEWFKRALRYVPPAVLSAILVPELFQWNGTLNFSLHNPQILAGLLAILVAWRTRSVLYALGAGLACYFLLFYLNQI